MKKFNKNSLIFLTGHKGLVGTSILKLLRLRGYKKIITATKKKIRFKRSKKGKFFL